MALTRTQMTQDEATNLASLIDRSHLPVHVKRVTGENIVEIQDDTTGYVLPIVSLEHWKQYERQIGGTNALDEFANAGVALLANLDKMLEGLKFERDNLMAQAEQVDGQVTHYQNQRDTIERAINAAGEVSLLALAKGVTVAPAPTLKPGVKIIHRTPQPKNMPTQGEYIVRKLNQDGRIKISTLAVEMSRVYPITKERAATNISGEMSRQMKSNPNIQRVAPGEFILVIEGKHS